MNDGASSPQRGWTEKFRDAFRGVKAGIRGQSSFVVHCLAAMAVVAAAAALKIDTPAEWCLLLLCIATVLTAEMFNSALESLAKAITDQWNPHLETALNVSSAAVLIAAMGASVVGTLIFVNRLGMLLSCW